MPEHRVEFFQFIYTLERLLKSDMVFLILFTLLVKGFELGLNLCYSGKELMQGRIQRANGDRESIHGRKETLEILLLKGQQLVERFLTFLRRISQDHLLYDRNPIFCKEHVLSTTQPDSFGSELNCLDSVAGNVGIGPYSKRSKLIGPLHQLRKLTGESRLDGRHRTDNNLTCGTIQGDYFTFFDGKSSDLKTLSCQIHSNGISTAHTALAHTTCHHGSM